MWAPLSQVHVGNGTTLINPALTIPAVFFLGNLPRPGFLPHPFP